jgi:protease-4
MNMAQDEVRPVVVAASGASSAPPPQIIIQQKSTVFGRFGKWLLAALVIAVLVSISMYNRYNSYFSPPDMPQEKYHSLAQFASKKIAIVEVSGAIMEGEDSFAEKQIDRVREDPDVVGIVVRVNSPGGTVTGSDFIYHHLRELAEKRKLPIVVSMGSVCASGGYYVAMSVGSQPDSIFAEPTTWTGSIGVIIPHFDVSGGLAKLGISEDSIASGPLKKMGSPTRPMSPEEKKILQTLVDDSFKDFKAIVANGRPKFKDDPAKLDAVATGQIFTAKQALAKGLVDKIGFIDAAIARATELAGENASSVRCVKYEKRPTFFGSVLGSEAQVPPARGMPDLSAVLDLATPRAYYLWSWLPTAFSNSR